jgi:hypothetical protein
VTWLIFLVKERKKEEDRERRERERERKKEERESTRGRMRKEVVLRGVAVLLWVCLWWVDGLSVAAAVSLLFLLHFAAYFETRRLQDAVDKVSANVAKLSSSPPSSSSYSSRPSPSHHTPSPILTISHSNTSLSPSSSSSSAAASSSSSSNVNFSEDGEVPFGDSPCPEFPFQVTDIGSSVRKEIRPNYRLPIPLENEWFKGKCVMKVRTDPVDPVFKGYFAGRRRYFELQVQGRFKVAPPGAIYMGIEVPPPALSLSFFSRGIANLVLGLLKKMVPDSHSSFGAKNECPHMVFPLVTAMDTFIVTPEGEDPPPLGVDPFPETSHRDAFLVADPSRREGSPLPSFSFLLSTLLSSFSCSLDFLLFSPLSLVLSSFLSFSFSFSLLLLFFLLSNSIPSQPSVLAQRIRSVFTRCISTSSHGR